jgi:hypothetical protein
MTKGTRQMLATGAIIAIEVEVELVHRRVEGIDHGNQQQRVTIRGCPHDRLGGNIADGAGAILDDE